MGARYYDQLSGRFLSIDPVRVDPNTGGNWNRYAYAGNNPYKFVDPDGRFIFLAAIPEAIAACTASGLCLGGVAVATVVTGGIAAHNLSGGVKNGAFGHVQNSSSGVESKPESANEAESENDQPTETALTIVKERDGNKVAQDLGYDDAHDAKDGYGGSLVNIYKDKETGNYWIWNGEKGTEKTKL